MSIELRSSLFLVFSAVGFQMIFPFWDLALHCPVNPDIGEYVLELSLLHFLYLPDLRLQNKHYSKPTKISLLPLDLTVDF